MIYLKSLINTIIAILLILVFLDSLLSYFIREDNGLRRIMGRILNPLYKPIRRLIPPLAGIDFTPLIAVILLMMLDAILFALLSLLG